MATFVLVHGGWGGGWQWQQVAARLRASGHVVYAPTLTGLGDRSHVAVVDVTLSLHIQDVAQLLYFEDLRDVTLVGWSYGGAVVDGVADRVPERIRHVVNLDGEVVQEGRALQDGWTDAASADMAEILQVARDTGWLPAPAADDLADVIDDPALRAWVGERERPHPFGTDTEPYPDTGGRRHAIRHTYLRCVVDGWPEEPSVTALRSDPRCDFRELPLNHLGLLYAPDVVAEALNQLAD